MRRQRAIKNIAHSLRCSILIQGGDVAARDAGRDRGKQDEAIALIDRGGNMIRTAPIEADPHFLVLQMNDYYYHRASALIEGRRNRDALQELKLIKEKYPRLQASTAILQPQAYLNSGKYERAAGFAEYALEIALDINSVVNINRIRGIFQQLQGSPYKDSPDVARLDYLLNN